MTNSLIRTEFRELYQGLQLSLLAKIICKINIDINHDNLWDASLSKL